MRRPCFVEQQRILHFAGISNHTIVSDDHIFANVGIVADLAVTPDDRRAFYHYTILDNSALADKYLLANEGNALTTILQPRVQVRCQISSDFLQSVPGTFAAFKDARMLGLA